MPAQIASSGFAHHQHPQSSLLAIPSQAVCWAGHGALDGRAEMGVRVGQGRLSQDELNRDIKADFMSGFKNGLRFVRRGRGGW